MHASRICHRSEKINGLTLFFSQIFALGKQNLGYSILTYSLSCSSIFNEGCWFFKIGLISRIRGDDNSGPALGKIVKQVELRFLYSLSLARSSHSLFTHSYNPIFFTNKMSKNDLNLTLSFHIIILMYFKRNSTFYDEMLHKH